MSDSIGFLTEEQQRELLAARRVRIRLAAQDYTRYSRL